jgi:hypothetical protein
MVSAATAKEKAIQLTADIFFGQNVLFFFTAWPASAAKKRPRGRWVVDRREQHKFLLPVQGLCATTKKPTEKTMNKRKGADPVRSGKKARRAAVDATESNARMAMAARLGVTRVVAETLEEGADPNHVDLHHADGDAVLTCASQNGHTATACMLVEAGANLEHANLRGATALAMASFFNHLPTVEMLLEHGAKTCVRDVSGCTILQHACEKGHTALAVALLEGKADANAHNHYDGSSPLGVACRSGCEALVRALLARGAVAHEKEDVAELSAKHPDIRRLVQVALVR